MQVACPRRKFEVPRAGLTLWLRHSQSSMYYIIDTRMDVIAFLKHDTLTHNYTEIRWGIGCLGIGRDNKTHACVYIESETLHTVYLLSLQGHQASLLWPPPSGCCLEQ